MDPILVLGLTWPDMATTSLCKKNPDHHKRLYRAGVRSHKRLTLPVIYMF